VVIWTRVADGERADQDLNLELELALDADFKEALTLDGSGARSLVAEAAFDHAVRVRVDGLTPATHYYYRFSYESSGGRITTRVGRTKTAPADDDTRALRFAVVCCQDYNGRYYHVHRRLVSEELDFVLHLGDYVYETVGLPPFPAGSRQVTLGRPNEALVLNGGAALAVRTLDNYRDLYRTYRSDRDLQALHERFPIIAIWDDHEYSDDCHGATATYFDGRRDETDFERRAAADQAWFEYMPVDFSAAPSSSWDPSQSFPDNLRIYRSFGFGRHLELVLTDLRRYRPDHLVPENALPGAIFVTDVELGADAPSELVPYVEIDGYAEGAYQKVLRENALELELDSDSVTGKVSVPWINAALEKLTAADLPAPIPLDDPELARGYSYQQVLKASQFSQVGARYLVAEAPFHALAAARNRETDGAAQRVMGDAQRAWFLDTLARSERTFKVWGSEVAFMPKVIDLGTNMTLPAELRRRILISAEDWDGFPDERRALLSALSELDNLVVLSGDLHCFFVGTPFDPSAPERRVIEFLTGSVTSTTWLEATTAIIASDPTLPKGAAFLVAGVGGLLQDPVTRPNPHLAFEELSKNGFSIIDVDGDALRAELLMIPAADLKLAPSELSGPLERRFTSERFRVQSGSKTLEREKDGVYTRWDTESASWVGG
jgi:alkaline phosphatase D